jgi:hypothetical protein
MCLGKGIIENAVEILICRFFKESDRKKVLKRKRKIVRAVNESSVVGLSVKVLMHTSLPKFYCLP